MVNFWITAGCWKWCMTAKPTLEQALALVERAVVVSRVVGYWSRNGEGERQLMQFLDAARQRKRSTLRSYSETGWFPSSGRGRAQASLGSAALFLEAWADAQEPDEQRVDQLRTAVVFGVAQMCEAIAKHKPNSSSEFPNYMDAVFGDLAEVQSA